MGDMDRQIDLEQQRANMGSVLREASKALIIAVGPDGNVLAAQLGCSPIEVLGLAKAISDNITQLLDIE